MPPFPASLTEDQITAIAAEVRTRPLSEVGRHVMPLIHHIGEMGSRSCHWCRFWVAYNQPDATASVGECTYHYAADARVKIVMGSDGTSITTPFDWQCPAWESRSESGSDAQKREAR